MLFEKRLVEKRPDPDALLALAQRESRSRHTKRWQDVKELLGRGIDVYTTLNIQHLESLNDVVAQITGVVVRETVPDALLDEAESVELVDLPPDELLKRLQEGKVYVPEQAEWAVQNFFRESNLTALRELALRTIAEQVNARVLSFREGQAVQETWPTAERLLVCIGPSISSAKLIRAARRLAAVESMCMRSAATRPKPGCRCCQTLASRRLLRARPHWLWRSTGSRRWPGKPGFKLNERGRGDGFSTDRFLHLFSGWQPPQRSAGNDPA